MSDIGERVSLLWKAEEAKKEVILKDEARTVMDTKAGVFRQVGERSLKVKNGTQGSPDGREREKRKQMEEDED